MASDTKERILKKALEMFSEHGYDGTSMRALAKELGLSKSAIYRHFSSKEEICDTLMMNLVKYYKDKLEKAGMLYAESMDDERFIAMVMHMVESTIDDDVIIMTRKLIAAETFRRSISYYYASQNLQDGMEVVFTGIFQRMMDCGYVKKDDPMMMGFAFVSPITSLIHLAAKNEISKQDAMDYTRQFVEYFLRMHKA